MNNEEYFDKINLIITKISNKYKDEPIILEKLGYYINNNLYTYLEQICIKEKKKYNNFIETINQREEKKLQIIHDQEAFANRFIQIHTYFYINNTDIYIYYNNIQFKTKKEDDILHDILKNISLNKNLIPWKHKIKVATIKKIKDQNINKVIPNSITIQNCLKFLIPNIFSSREEAKYFLTIIGDCILKKNDNLIYLIGNNFKDIFKILSDHCYYYFGVNLNNNFKYKYHEQHSHSNYRLVTYKIDNINNIDFSIFNKNILDILCICIHYSNRFNNAELFLNNIDNEELASYSLHLKNNNMINLVNDFIHKYTVKSENTNITFKNMLYIWKLYLTENKLPTLVFQNTLKILLKEQISFNEEQDIFMNIFSPSLPVVSNFIEFWENTITEDEMGLEVSEINILFRSWNKVTINIKSVLILDIIKHYYPDIVIEEDKYILNITCNLWNKKEDVNKFLEEFKIELIKNNEVYPLAIDYLYDKYRNTKNNLIVNKKDFEKYTKDILINYIDNDNLILSTWWN